jgi:hypothetical protein
VKAIATEASDGSFTGVRENDVLTQALENPEHRGRVRAVSSSSGWQKVSVKNMLGCIRRKRHLVM